MPFSSEKIKAFRFLRSGLLQPFEDAETCAAQLLGIQSQIYTAASLSIAARTTTPTHAVLHQRFSESRSLVKTWGQRSTVHLYAAENYRLVITAMREDSSWKERQFVKQGGTAAQFRALISAAAEFLRARGACTRADMTAFTDAQGVGELLTNAWGGILVDLGRRGHLCLGGYETGAQAQMIYASESWNPSMPAYDGDFDTANATLMQAYFRHYGPASFKDFCHWRGVSQTKARPWLAAIRPGLEVVASEKEEMYLPAEDVSEFEELAATAADLPGRLLYRFDPMVLAHKDKTWLVQENDYKQVWRKAAHVEGVVLKNGEAVGVWKFQRKGARLRFLVSWFRSRNKLGKRELNAQLQRIAHYLGYADWEISEEKF